MPEPCEYCGAALTANVTACGTCGRPVPRREAGKRASCDSCGAAVPAEAAMCTTCGRVRDDEGDRKRAAWARAAAERDAAWLRRPCEHCGAAVPADASMCGTCGRSRAERPVTANRPCEYCGAQVAVDATSCNTCGRSLVNEVVVEPAHDDAEGDRKRAEWARAAAERDAAWRKDHACDYCGAGVATGASACGTCGRPQPARNQVVEPPRRQTARGIVVPPDPEGDRKRAEWERTAAERDAAWHRKQSPPPKSSRGRHLALFAGVAVVVAAVVIVIVARRPGSSAPAVAPAPESAAVRIAKATSFGEAIAIARPMMVDTTDDLGDGAKLLASYAMAKLTWAEVAVPAETTLARIAKDPAAERGKRLCADGEIVRIERRDLGTRRVHVGRLRAADGEVAFVAAGTTGDLAAGRTGKLCGAALGRSGGAVSILGMFDFEENRRPLVEQ